MVHNINLVYPAKDCNIKSMLGLRRRSEADALL